MNLPFEVDWQMVGCRAMMIKLLSEKQIKELHELENTRGERYGYGKGNNWLIKPFNIRKLYFNDLRELEITERNLNAVIILIKGQIPKDNNYEMSHDLSVEWQHAWDWNMYRNVAKFDEGKRKFKKGDGEQEED